MRHFKHRFALIFLLAAVYTICGKFGLGLAFAYPSATPVWPCSGIALAAILIFGKDLWPAILLGAFLVNMTITPVAASAGIAVGNTLEALLGAALVLRFADGRNSMTRVSGIFKFAIFGGAAAALAAAIGSETLIWIGAAKHSHALSVWFTWWLGDTVGMIIVTPILLLWTPFPSLRWRWKSALEAIGLLACLITIGLIVFDGLFTSGIKNYPFEYLCIPFLIWAASRFGQREAAVATLILSGIAIWGTYKGFGPFALKNKNESLLLLQAFLGVGAVMTLVLASEVSERRRAEKDALNLAVMDRLTGLGNYRKLIDTLESEMKRSERMKRTFAFVLMDLDGLKQINDGHGHAAGNRALRRLAEVLQIHCRSIDTAARYGGDEFGLILPECGSKFGHLITNRIRERLASDGEMPAISVSFGIAVWPEDGTTVDEMLQSADRALYEMKHRHYTDPKMRQKTRQSQL